MEGTVCRKVAEMAGTREGCGAAQSSEGCCRLFMQSQAGKGGQVCILGAVGSPEGSGQDRDTVGFWLRKDVSEYREEVAGEVGGNQTMRRCDRRMGGSD